MCMRVYVKEKLQVSDEAYSKEKCIPIPLHKAWCERCNSKTEVEVIPSVQKILEVIENIKKKMTEPIMAKDYFDENKLYNKGLTEQEKQEEIQYHLRFLEWRKKRKSPRKCLECGSEGIREIEEDEQLWDSLGEICNLTFYYDYEGNKL